MNEQTNKALDKMAENAKELGLDYAPPKREWVGLTEEDVEQWCIFNEHYGRMISNIVRSVEAKLKEKNQ